MCTARVIERVISSCFLRAHTHAHSYLVPLLRAVMIRGHVQRESPDVRLWNILVSRRKKRSYIGGRCRRARRKKGYSKDKKYFLCSSTCKRCFTSDKMTPLSHELPSSQENVSLLLLEECILTLARVCRCNAHRMNIRFLNILPPVCAGNELRGGKRGGGDVAVEKKNTLKSICAGI